jgi:hypothetical protein
MRAMNRRDMVVRVGAVAGLATLAPGRGRAEAIGPGVDPTAVLRAIRLNKPDEAAHQAHTGSGPAPWAMTTTPGTAARPAHDVEAVPIERADATGRVFARGLTFTCDPRKLNRLTVAGRPLVARRISFSADQIDWTPGRGMPVYTTYCPRFEYVPHAHYPEAKWHQLVPRIGDRYFTGCTATDLCVADTPGPVAFDVNAQDHASSDGAYVITIWSWC